MIPVKLEFWPARPIVVLRILVAVAAAIALAIAAPLIWALASAGAGLLVLATITLIGLALAQSLPLVLQKFENRLLAKRKAEARNSPIEQLQNFLIEKKRDAQAFKSAVARIGAQIATLEDMIEERRRSKPTYDASKQERSLQGMREAHAVLMKKFLAAEDALVELEEAVEDKRFEMSFGSAGQEAMAKLDAVADQDPLDQILAEEAFAAVRANFHRVFADLEMETAKLSARDFRLGDADEAPRLFRR
jgi:hypothetical protein